MTKMKQEYRLKQRPDNRRLAQWRVQWLIEHFTSHQLLWCIDSFVLRNPPERKAANRYHSKHTIDLPYNKVAGSADV